MASSGVMGTAHMKSQEVLETALDFIPPHLAEVSKSKKTSHIMCWGIYLDIIHCPRSFIGSPVKNLGCRCKPATGSVRTSLAPQSSLSLAPFALQRRKPREDSI